MHSFCQFKFNFIRCVIIRLLKFCNIFSYKDDIVFIRNLNAAHKFETAAWLERLIVIGLHIQPRRILLSRPGTSGHIYILMYSSRSRNEVLAN